MRPGNPLSSEYPVESLNDLIAVITALCTKLESDPESFENGDLGSFLMAMAAWLSSFPQYYMNTDQPIPEPDWNFVADCLLAARVYE